MSTVLKMFVWRSNELVGGRVEVRIVCIVVVSDTVARAKRKVIAAARTTGELAKIRAVIAEEEPYIMELMDVIWG